MSMPDPAQAMREIVGHLRPGGIAAFQERILRKDLMPLPLLPFWTKSGSGLLKRLENPAQTQRWGTQATQPLPRAGLFDLHLEADQFIGGGADWSGYAHLAGLVKSVLPFLETSGITTAKEVGPDTWEERLRQDIFSRDGVVVWLTLVRLWGRKQ